MRGDKMIECYNDRVMRNETENIVKSYDFSFLKNSKVLVTGATGLLGTHLAFAIAMANRLQNLGLKLYLQYRNPEKALRIYGSEFLSREDIYPVTGNITDELNLPEEPDYIFHTASPTSSRYFVTHPVETVLDAVNGTANVLKHGKNAKAAVYLSSLEVYGICENETVNEQSYGYIDYRNVRSSYSEGKRICETLCTGYWKEYGVPVKTVRLSQTFGTGVEYGDGRVFAEFLRCAMEKRNIVLHTAGNTLRSYLDAADAVTGILTVAEKGEAGEVYNLSNPKTAISIREMASAVAGFFPESGIDVITDIPENLEGYGYNPEMKIILDIQKAEALGWHPQYDLSDMYKKMRDSILSRREQ